MRRYSLTLLALAMFAGTTCYAQQYTIDHAHSFASFSVRHMMISNAAGRFTDVSGIINYDEKDPAKSSVDAHIKTTTINTDNDYRDKDLRGPNYFDVEKFPEIVFKSEKVEKRGNQWVAIGALTMHGVSRRMELPFEIAKADTPQGTAIGVTASTKLNRKDFGINGGGVAVGDDIKIELSIEAKPAKAASPAVSAPKK